LANNFKAYKLFIKLVGDIRSSHFMFSFVGFKVELI